MWNLTFICHLNGVFQEAELFLQHLVRVLLSLLIAARDFSQGPGLPVIGSECARGQAAPCGKLSPVLHALKNKQKADVFWSKQPCWAGGVSGPEHKQGASFGWKPGLVCGPDPGRNDVHTAAFLFQTAACAGRPPAGERPPRGRMLQLALFSLLRRCLGPAKVLQAKETLSGVTYHSLNLLLLGFSSSRGCPPVWSVT